MSLPELRSRRVQLLHLALVCCAYATLASLHLIIPKTTFTLDIAWVQATRRLLLISVGVLALSGVAILSVARNTNGLVVGVSTCAAFLLFMLLL